MGLSCLQVLEKAAPAQLPATQATSDPSPAAKVGTLKLLSSKATWAIIVVNFVNHWGYFIYLNWMPSYFVRALGVDLRASSILSFLPWTVMAVGSTSAGLPFWEQHPAHLHDPTLSKETIVIFHLQTSGDNGFLQESIYLVCIVLQPSHWHRTWLLVHQQDLQIHQGSLLAIKVVKRLSSLDSLVNLPFLAPWQPVEFHV